MGILERKNVLSVSLAAIDGFWELSNGWWDLKEDQMNGFDEFSDIERE